MGSGVKSAGSPGSVHAPSVHCGQAQSWALASQASKVVRLEESSFAGAYSVLGQSAEVLASTAVPYTVVAGIQPWG